MLDKFRAALVGVFYCLRTQVNMVIHLTAAAAVVAAGVYFHVRPWEWAVLTLTITMVIAAEAFNTALEVAVDLYTSKYHPLARIAKDVAAGAVLMTAIGAIIIACIIFGPRLGLY
ncbi:MAG: diacylglycerol kinase family protein [Moorella humiferrea]|uniref:Undecaprenol kinase n=1 Tax=Neomoorella humiferrea TaxID=676965 RepID=A0A2T0AW38_9FIRM|nr:diacylglycerol kinase family protein [Moorella humiferrea]MBE3572924.1 diacylglycerol kinase family protein [Moorella humiferrea]PRR74921.1 Undecaprenol kinase [Moorella humiferrea]